MNFDVLFPDNRETGESVLRQSQLVMLRMFKIFDYLCVRHQIKYFLTGGSLIGAVRHQGFIPWDDDLDVGMTRENYELFLQKAVPELPADIFFQNPQTDPHYPQNANVEARLRDKFSSYSHIGIPNNPWHEGLQVDIFVYDRAYLPNNLAIIAQNKLLKLVNSNKRRAAIQQFISRYIPLPLVYCSNFMLYFSEKKLGTYITPKEYRELTRVKFEDGEAYIPKGYDSYLKRQYGNYMRMPPEEKRISHHNVVVDPFRHCGHEQVLDWQQRKKKISINPGM